MYYYNNFNFVLQAITISANLSDKQRTKAPIFENVLRLLKSSLSLARNKIGISYSFSILKFAKCISCRSPMVPLAIECSFGFYSAVNSVRYSSNDNYRNTNFN